MLNPKRPHCVKRKAILLERHAPGSWRLAFGWVRLAITPRYPVFLAVLQMPCSLLPGRLN